LGPEENKDPGEATRKTGRMPVTESPLINTLKELPYISGLLWSSPWLSLLDGLPGSLNINNSGIPKRFNKAV
jgi:hypothetical protein